MSVIVKVVLGVLCLVGISEIVWNIILHLIRPKDNDRPVLLIRLKGDAETVEQKLRSADVVTRLLGGSGCDGLVVVDCGMDDEARDVASRYIRPRENIVLCTPNELFDLLKNF